MTEIEMLGQLPEPYASQAIVNFKKESCNGLYRKYFIGGDPYEIILGIIYGGFTWHDTPEGETYWIDFTDFLESQIK